jgi:hypothetical protein
MSGLSQPELLDYRDRSGLFDGIAGVWAINANLTEIDQPERVEALLASPSYFDVLGVRPQLGRLFGPEDTGAGINEVLVISDALWHPAASARRRTRSAASFASTTTGTPSSAWLPPGFRHPGRSVLTDVDVWAPANFAANPFPEAVRSALLHHRRDRTAEAGHRRRQARSGWRRSAQELRTAYPNDYPARAAWAPR